jgi:hypothetical protein
VAAHPATLPEPEFPVPPGMPEVVDQVALARLYGEPLFAMPTDLYIRRMRWRSSSKPSKARWTCCCT